MELSNYILGIILGVLASIYFISAEESITKRSCECALVSADPKYKLKEVIGRTEFEAWPEAKCHQVRRGCRHYCEKRKEELTKPRPLLDNSDGTHRYGFKLCQALDHQTHKGIKLVLRTEVEHCPHKDVIRKWSTHLCCGYVWVQSESRNILAWEPECNGLNYSYA